MTKEEIPITPPPRPADSFTAQDATRLYAMIDSGLKKISSTLEEFSNRLAGIQRQQIDTQNLVKLIEADSADNRFKRIELEIGDAERERDIAIQNLHAIERKLAEKQNIKDQNVDTGERLKGIVATAISSEESKKREARSARLEDLKWTLIKGSLMIVLGGITTAVVSFVWFLVQLYLNRGGP